jgi:peptidyl-prolyl cis-trans isomerase D
MVSADLDALLQRREVQLERFDPASHAATIKRTEEDLAAYHKANAQKFMAPERATIEYVVLDLDSLGHDLKLSEDDLRKYYDENIARYTSAEERRASHILIKADKDLPAAERAKAKARAQAILAEVRKAPSSFAEVARKQSEDTGSAGQGGDLGLFGRGTMVKPFEDAVFAMKKGEISDVVESDFGYHVIELTDISGGHRKPFAEVRPEIEAEVRKSLAQKRYAEAAEQFSETVYQQYDSLQPVVDKLKLKLQSAVVGRTPAAGATGALASQKLLAAVFGSESLANKRNTDAVEIGPNQMASARIVKHEPAHALTLAEVHDRVRAAVVAEQAAALARRDGQARLQAVKSGQAKLEKTETISRAQTQGLPREVVDAVLRADIAKEPAVIGVDLGEHGYVVAKVLKVLPREPLPGGDAQVQAQIAQALAAAETEAYLAALKTRYKAELVPTVVEQVARSASTP